MELFKSTKDKESLPTIVKKYLVFHKNIENAGTDVVIVEAKNKDHAKDLFVKNFILKDDDVNEYLNEKAINAGFVARFFYFGDDFCLDNYGEPKYSEKEIRNNFKRNVSSFFNNKIYNDIFLKEYYSDSDYMNLPFEMKYIMLTSKIKYYFGEITIVEADTVLIGGDM